MKSEQERSGESGDYQIVMVNKQGILHLLKTTKNIQQLHQVHGHAITSGILNHCPSFLPNVLYIITSFASNTGKLPSSYIQLLINYASSVFRNIRDPTTFCYNTMIRAHNLLSSPTNTLLMYINMRRFSVPPDFHTFPFILKSCGELQLASALHSQAFKFGFIEDLFVLNSIIHVYSVSNSLHHACLLFEESSHKDVISYNTLIDAYVKAGDTSGARHIFDSMLSRDAVSWGTLMAGYTQMKQFNDTLNLFDEMLSHSDLCPDNVSLVSALSACAQLGDLEQGISIHNYITNKRRRIDSFLSTSLVDFYAKCGCIDTALEVFESSTEKNVYTWNVMLVGLAMHGHGNATLNFFSKMMEDQVQPDGVTFLGLLVGCSHGGLVSEARKLFDDMEDVHGVPRELKHYGCMADLFGRAGLISEALKMIETMPNGGDIYVWGALLAGCRAHGLVEIAELAAKRVYELKPEDSGSHSVMANIYANAELWDDVIKVRSLLNAKKVKKIAGFSLIKVDGVNHEFIAGDVLHSKTEEIYMILNGFRNHQFESSGIW